MEHLKGGHRAGRGTHQFAQESARLRDQARRRMTGSTTACAAERGRGALSAPAPDPICVAGQPPGVVAFHGFGGTTREIELCTEVARELGLAARARSLPGHGSHARDLARTRFTDWVAGGERVLQELTAAGPAIA